LMLNALDVDLDETARLPMPAIAKALPSAEAGHLDIDRNPDYEVIGKRQTQ
jgi:hypothetical protein